ncbi:Thioredoxin [hydrothermal vent metagenome]|uniref:Thioredoxin n=1 Tax=hydrothermal vent metagenome TaxID=652676 RepID=A0A1W1C2N0_9ZZZZ
MKKHNHKMIIIAVLILILSSIYFYLSKQKKASLNSNQNFIFTSIKNKKFNIVTYKNHIQVKELKGKIIFLKVFSWNCPYCKKEIPELIQLKNKFRTAFDTIAIESEKHSNQENLDFIEKNHINYNIIDGEKQKRFLDYLKQEYKWDGVIPTTIVIGGDGKILAFEVGYKSYSLTSLLKTTLQMLTKEAVTKKKGENKK